MPVLRSHSSDGTPVKTKKAFTQRLDSEHRARRQGAASHEYLVQRLFLAFRSGEEWQCDVVFPDPLPLVNGKGTEELFKYGRTLFPMLRALGHRGVAVHHFAFDRGVHAPLLKRLLQLHDLQ